MGLVTQHNSKFDKALYDSLLHKEDKTSPIQNIDRYSELVDQHNSVISKRLVDSNIDKKIEEYYKSQTPLIDHSKSSFDNDDTRFLKEKKILDDGKTRLNVSKFHVERGQQLLNKRLEDRVSTFKYNVDTIPNPNKVIDNQNNSQDNDGKLENFKSKFSDLTELKDNLLQLPNINTQFKTPSLEDIYNNIDVNIIKNTSNKLENFKIPEITKKEQTSLLDNIVLEDIPKEEFTSKLTIPILDNSFETIKLETFNTPILDTIKNINLEDLKELIDNRLVEYDYESRLNIVEHEVDVYNPQDNYNSPITIQPFVTDLLENKPIPSFSLLFELKDITLNSTIFNKLEEIKDNVLQIPPFNNNFNTIPISTFNSSYNNILELVSIVLENKDSIFNDLGDINPSDVTGFTSLLYNDGVTNFFEGFVKFQTSTLFDFSRVGTPFLTGVDFFSNDKRLGFELYSNESLYKEDSIFNVLGEVNHFYDNWNKGFTKEVQESEYINHSEFRNLGNVNYFYDNWNTGFTNNPIPLLTEYKTNSIFNNLGEVNHFYDNWNKGFTKEVQPLLTEYINHSEFRNLGNVNFFRDLYNKGFTNNPIPLLTEYKLVSLFNNLGEVNHFYDNWNKGFTKEVQESEYKLVSLFNVLGEVNYFYDNWNKGFTKEVNESEYKLVSLFNELNEVNHFYDINNTGFTKRVNDSEYKVSSFFNSLEDLIHNPTNPYTILNSKFDSEEKSKKLSTIPDLVWEGDNYPQVNYINDKLTFNFESGKYFNRRSSQLDIEQTNFTGDSQKLVGDYKFNNIPLNQLEQLGRNPERYEQGLKQILSTPLINKDLEDSIDEKIYSKFNSIQDVSFNVDKKLQPFITREIGERWTEDINPIMTDDTLLRSGITSYNNRSLEDYNRIKSFMLTGKGLNFILKQTGLYLSNPSVDPYPSGGGGGILDDIFGVVKEIIGVDRPTQRFNPLSIPLQVKSGIDGEINRTYPHGLGDPYKKKGTYLEQVLKREENTNSLIDGSTGLLLRNVDKSSTVGSTGNHNRLLMIANELFDNHLSIRGRNPQNEESSEGSSGGGIIDTLLGVGKKALKKLGRYALNSINLPISVTPLLSLLGIGYKGQIINRLSQKFGGPGSRMGIGPSLVHRFESTDGILLRSDVGNYFFNDNQYASFVNKNKIYTTTKNVDESGLNNVEDLEEDESGNRLLALKKLYIDHVLGNYEEFKDTITVVPYEDSITINTIKDGRLYNIKRRYADFESNSSRDIRNEDIVRSQTKSTITSFEQDPELGVLGESDRISTFYERYINSGSILTTPSHRVKSDSFDRNISLSPSPDSIINSYVTLDYKGITELQNDTNSTQYRKLNPVDFRKYITNNTEIKNIKLFSINDNKVEVKDDVEWKRYMTDPDILDYSNNNRINKYGEGNNSSQGEDGGFIDRSNPIQIKLPNKPLKGNSEEWLEIQKLSRGDKINLIDVINDKTYDSDLDLLNENINGNNVKDQIRFYITTTGYFPGNSKDASFLIFRPFNLNIGESFQSTYSSTGIMGRGDYSYTYGGFSRTFSLSWELIAFSREEQYSNYRKLNKLASFTAPNYGKNGNQQMKGTVLRVTLGDLYNQTPMILESVSVDFNLESGWETGHLLGDRDKGTLNLPKHIKITTSWKVIGNHRPQVNGAMYELTNRGDGNLVKWIDTDKVSSVYE